MEDNLLSSITEGRITDIRFSVATHDEVCTSSISDAAINHPTQLTNSFLGLPLESGKCDSCGTAEPGKCEGHFGYIDLPIEIYHPCHISELKKLLSLVCLQCLRLKRGKNVGSDRSTSAPCLYCKDLPHVLINEAKTTDGVVLLELKLARKSAQHSQVWNFLDRYGYHYGDGRSRTLLPCEVLEILKRFPEETRKKLSSKGYFTQDGYILRKLPVPPNCLSIPDISDGVSIMSCDISVSMLRKVLKQAEIIKCSRSGRPNFESHKVEVNDLQSTVAQYLRARGTAKDTRDIKMRSGISKEAEESATKAWLEKMRTYFISKGSGYCSRSVITGDAYKKVNEIGLPLEVAQRITFEEKVTECNKVYLQELMDNKLCLTYRDGSSTYSLREGSKGHTFLKVGQVVQRRIMDGDVVFINRPPSTHKHSLQALSVYVHEDHTVKVNPLICGPLDADFDGDCVHLFYPQSLAARAEVLELFSVEQQLLSSHSGILNLQLKNDSLLSLKIMFKNFFLDKLKAQQLAMFISTNLPQPSLLKVNSSGVQWTVLQILETVLPDHFDCLGERYFIKQSKILKLDFNRDVLQSMFNEIISAVLFQMSSKEALKVFNCLQPLLMESLFLEGYSVGLKDFYVPMTALENLPMNIEKVSRLLHQLRSKYNELVELQVGNDLRSAKAPVVNFILKLSGLGNLIDSKSESSINKVVEQIGFLGLQLADRGKFYSNNLVRDMTSLFLCKYAVNGVNYPSEAFGLIKSCFFHGLNPYESLVHSISSREVLVRSSRGLTEPGTLFKNLMTILRDVVICYDGTVRNVCSNSIIQFEYGVEVGSNSDRFYPAGEPVGALAATAISNPSYKAVLDSSSSSNTSWELMKEVLVCKVNFMNDLNDRRVILYLNDCCCVKKHCKENAAYLVQNQLKRVSLRDIAVNFLIEYQNQQTSLEAQGANSRLVGHIHLDKKRLAELDRSMHELLLRCREMIGLSLSRRSRKSTLVDSLKNILLSVSECCCFEQSYDSKRSRWCQFPCLQFSWRLDMSRYTLETTSQIMANTICPFLLDTIIKGDRRVTTANIIWISPDTTTWVTNNSKTHNGELAVEVVLEKKFVKQHGDAWRLALDSCLPVMHLIDTKRSIPYAIRQVQEILGISCAFDQAVQRLSTSIKMVSKGVLKEHLILAVNSMTCTGSLIGFNKGGYKALFRSLNVQLPFTEATLFTPRKCFEKAAEKCHTDTLSGIVASCSWGKHVAVGSGTRFEILWNKKEMGSENNGAIDIYNFLQLVRTGSTGGESNTSCLGEDYDDLEFENRNADLSLSPEHNFDHSKPTFDDADLQCGFDEDQTADKGNSWESNWEKGVSEVKSGGSSDWKIDEHAVVENGLAWDKPNDSSAWGSAKEPVDAWGSAKEPVEAWGKQTNNSQQAKPNDSSAWVASADASWNTLESEKLPSKEPTDVWGAQKLPSKEPTNAWGSAKEPVDAWGEQTNNSQQAKPNDSSAWGASADASWNTSESEKLLSKEPTDVWGAQKLPSKEPTNTWGSAREPVDAWGKQTSETQRAKPNDSSAWGASADASWNISESKKLPSKEPTDVWGEQKLPSKEPTDAWGKQTAESDATGWNKNLTSTSQGWESEANGWDKKTVSNDSSTDAVWTTSESHKLPSKPVDATQTTIVSSRPNDYSAWGASTDAGWNKSESEKFPSSEPADAWGKQKLPSKVPTDGWKKQTNESDGWGASGDAEWNRSESEKLPSSEPADAWGKKKLPSKVPTDGWEKQTNESDTTGGDKNLNSGSLGWDSPSGKDWTKNGTTQDEQERASPHDTWGKNAEEKETSGGWNQREQGDEPTSSHGRNSQSATGWSKHEEHQDELPCNNWGKKAETKSSGDWSQPTGSQGWDSSSATEWQNGHSQTEKERTSSWGRGKKQSGRGWGSSNSGDWKQNSRPAKSPGRFDDRNARGNYNPTRPKFEEYTSEEKKILSDMEPILQSIRRIMHQSGYNDGDPLSADDQSFVLDNVFNYHPDKAVKMGLGVDHVMISKHSSFQDTRCFYIVSTDGRKEDFSYRKCLENFVKEKYPEIAVSFNGKYFSRKPRNRWGSEPDGSAPQPDAAAASQPDAAAVSQP